MKIRRIEFPLLASVVIGTALGCGEGEGESSNQGSPVAQTGSVAATVPSGAKPAPTEVFQLLGGGEASFSELSGTVVVANLWGTWCLPCRTELPELVSLASWYEDKPVTILGIAVDSGTDQEIEDFLASYGVGYQNWITGMETAFSTFGALGFPFTVVIDRDGWVRKEFLGPQTAQALAKEIDALLE